MADLPVYFEQRLVGTIDVRRGGPGFTYDPRWIATKGAFPISTTMPLRPERIGPETLVPWAANLLPESEQLRAVGQFLGMSSGDVIGLLSAIGRDTAGALSIGKPGGTALLYWRPVERPEDLEKIIAELPRKPFLVGDEGVSISLAGAQTKLAVAIDRAGHICIPLEGSPSTHILKPDSDRLPGGVQNEAFCLTLARRLGLPTPDLTTGRAGARSYLLVQRYDRRAAGDRWRRLHQEDFCQALGKPPTAKYESSQTGIPGPTFADLFDTTRRLMAPNNLLQLLDMAIFNIIACNTDAHAKNYSLMITGTGVSLSPLYDVMCAQPWQHVTRKLALSIGGETRGDRLTGAHWRRFASACGLNGRQVVTRVRALAESAAEHADAAAGEVAAMPAGGHAILDETRAAVLARTQALLARLDEAGDRPGEPADHALADVPLGG